MMTRLSRILPLLGALALALTLSACGTLKAPSLTGQLQEVKTLNAQMSSQWANFDQTLGQTQGAVEQLGAMDVAGAKNMNVKLVQNALGRCFEEEAKPADSGGSGGATMLTGAQLVGRASATMKTGCQGGASLSAYMAKVDPGVAAFIDGKLASVTLIRANLKGRLPAMAESLITGYPEAKARALVLRKAADTAKSTVDGLPLPAVVKQQFDKEFQAMTVELTALETTLATIEAEAPNLQGRIATTVERATLQIGKFGQ